MPTEFCSFPVHTSFQVDRPINNTLAMFNHSIAKPFPPGTIQLTLVQFIKKEPMVYLIKCLTKF